MILILVARNQDGLLCQIPPKITDKTKQQSKMTYYCPACSKRVIVKKGTIKQPHFAHFKKESCDFFSEGETEEHLKGKQMLSRWCERSDISYQVEPFLAELNQRPDLLIAEKIAIEFHCSSLPLKRLVARTQRYRKSGYRVIWIVGEKLQLKDKLSALQRGFLYYQNSLGFYYWELKIEKEQVHLHCHIEKSEVGKVVYYTILKSGI